VVNESKNSSGEQFENITDLQNRFKSLKNENNMLIMRKRNLQKQLEEAKIRDRNNFNQLENILYEKQSYMQDLQLEIE
jgi:regulator of replication initiation timing